MRNPGEKAMGCRCRCLLRKAAAGRRRTFPARPSSTRQRAAPRSFSSEAVPHLYLRSSPVCGVDRLLHEDRRPICAPESRNRPAVRATSLLARSIFEEGLAVRIEAETVHSWVRGVWLSSMQSPASRPDTYRVTWFRWDTPGFCWPPRSLTAPSLWRNLSWRCGR